MTNNVVFPASLVFFERGVTICDTQTVVLQLERCVDFCPPKAFLQKPALVLQNSIFFSFINPLGDNILVLLLLLYLFCPFPFFILRFSFKHISWHPLVFIFGCLVRLFFIFELFCFHDWCFSLSCFSCWFLCSCCVCCFLFLFNCFCLSSLSIFVGFSFFLVSVVLVSDYDQKKVFSLQFKTNFGPHVLHLSVGNLASPKTYQHKRV